jgi:hypothetical protein
MCTSIGSACFKNVFDCETGTTTANVTQRDGVFVALCVCMFVLGGFRGSLRDNSGQYTPHSLPPQSELQFIVIANKQIEQYLYI